MNATAYPLAAFEMELPFGTEPYLTIGLGGAGFHADGLDENAFVARFAAGAELEVWERVGIYAEIGVGAVNFNGIPAVTRIALGGAYRF